ncbi:hypothetical protein Aeq9CBH6_12990 [Adlercreutzia equolifaciens]|nr:hypothetical protein Aeq9CBH6_12990 [Adlercreutzia equolifaciens]
MGLIGADPQNRVLPFRFGGDGRLGRSVGLHHAGVERTSRAKADEKHYRESKGSKSAKGDTGRKWKAPAGLRATGRLHAHRTVISSLEKIPFR